MDQAVKRVRKKQLSLNKAANCTVFLLLLFIVTSRPSSTEGRETNNQLESVTHQCSYFTTNSPRRWHKKAVIANIPNYPHARNMNATKIRGPR